MKVDDIFKKYSRKIENEIHTDPFLGKQKGDGA